MAQQQRKQHMPRPNYQPVAEHIGSMLDDMERTLTMAKATALMGLSPATQRRAEVRVLLEQLQRQAREAYDACDVRQGAN